MIRLMKHFLFCLILSVIFLSACQHEPLFDDNPIDNPIDTTGMNTGIPCDPDSVYFANQIFPILKSNCAIEGCHGNGSMEDGVDLSNYNAIINTADVEAFNANKSDLYKAITEPDLEDRMPPQPANGLSQEQIDLIAQWINQGALDNRCDDCDSTNTTFSLFVFPLVKNNCQGCHSGSTPSGNISLTNYDQIRTQALNGNLAGTIQHESGYVAMPYNQTKLNDCKIEQILSWIEEGALDN
jgi:mono/diheme cytochrome c family protein